MNEDAKKHAEQVGLDWVKVKKGLERLLPIAAMLARVTPNPYDDLAVAFLQSIIDAEKNAQ